MNVIKKTSKQEKGKRKIEKKKILIASTVIGITATLGLLLVFSDFFGEDEYVPPKKPIKTMPIKPVKPVLAPQIQKQEVPQPRVSQPQIPIGQKTEPKKSHISIDEQLIKEGLVGKYVKKAIDEAVKQIVEEEKRLIEKQLKEQLAQAQEKQAILKVNEKKKKIEKVLPTKENLPSIIKVRYKKVLPDGSVVLDTDIGILTTGASYKGWTVEQITDQQVVLKKGKKVKTIKYYLEI